MSKIKLRGSLIAIIIAAAAAVVAAIFLSGCGMAYTCVYPNADKYTVGDFEYSAGTVTSLDVDWTMGEVKVAASDGETLTVKETGAQLKDEQKMRCLVDNGTLYVKFWKSGYYGAVESVNKHVTIEVPKTLVGFKIDTVSAPVVADTVTADKVDVDTTSGDITLGAVTVSDKADIESTSGNIKIGSIDCREVKFDTTSGDIEAQALTASNDVSIESTSGNIKVKSVTAGDVKLDTTSGDIECESVTARGKLEIDTTSGDISVLGISALVLDFDASSGDARLGVLSSTRITIDVTSTDVTLELGGLGAEITLDTTSGEVITQLEHTTPAANKIVIGDGACKILFDTTSGDLTVK